MPIAIAIGVLRRKRNSMLRMSISAVISISCEGSEEKYQAVKKKKCTAQRDNAENDPFREGQGWTDLRPNEKSKSAAMVKHYCKETQGDDVNKNTAAFLPRLCESLRKYIYSGMYPAIIGRSGA
jgi:hypothetical protein